MAGNCGEGRPEAGTEGGAHLSRRGWSFSCIWQRQRGTEVRGELTKPAEQVEQPDMALIASGRWLEAATDGGNLGLWRKRHWPLTSKKGTPACGVAQLVTAASDSWMRRSSHDVVRRRLEAWGAREGVGK